MSRLLAAAAIVVCAWPLLAAGPIPFPAADEKWIRARSKHFILISSTGETQTREVAASLETLAAALTQVNPRLATSGAPARVIIFSRHSEIQPYFDALMSRENSNVSGLWIAQKGGGSMLISFDTRLEAARRGPLHELVHHLLENAGGPRLPLWLQEGLAEYYSHARLRYHSIIAGDPIPVHVDALTRHQVMPLQELFAVGRDSDAYNVANEQSVFYAESWAVVQWLIRYGGDRGEIFNAFLADVAGGTPPEQAIRDRYGKSLDDIRKAFTALTTIPLTTGVNPMWHRTIPAPATDTTVVSEPLDHAALLFELGRFLSGFDTMAPEAQRHFRAAVAENPKHARALAALGRFEEAVAADPQDADLLLDYAESLMATQIGPLAQTTELAESAAPRFRQARELVQRALALNADRARALGDLGITYIVEKDAAGVAPGLAALEEAHTLAPKRADVAVHLFALYRRLDDRAKAGALRKQIDALHDPQAAFAAQSIILRTGLDRANALVRQEKIAEAAAALRALAVESGAGGEAARDLERQAADLDHVAQQNREIAAYNRAVREMNSRAYADARKTIDDLLGWATDPDVIADARKLRTLLERRKR